jgi:hypothetical protein
MSDHVFLDRRPRLRAVQRALLFGGTLSLALAVVAQAAEPKQAESARRSVIGKCVTRSAAIVHRAPGGQWQLCRRDEPVYDGEQLVALSAAAVQNNRGSVRLSLLPDLDRLSALPVLESAVVMRKSPDKDLDFTLERGRVEVINERKGNEPSHIRIHFGKKNQAWDLTLGTPGARVALVLFGRWPRGTPFLKDIKTGEEPTADLSLFVLNGEVLVDTHTDQYALRGPPGPAYFHWDSVTGADAGPERRDQPPDWTQLAHAGEPNPLIPAVERLRELLQNSPVQEALTQMVHSPDPSNRRVAVSALGAVDDLPDLVAALSDPTHEDTRDAAIVTLRHWIGLGPGQDMRLYAFLVQSKSYTPNQASLVLQLLHSFGENDLARPATYETLIDYLVHDKLAIRQLAKWHLDRLVRAGRAITYDPAGSSKARQRAYEQWKKLVPAGKLPAEGKRK